MGKGEIQYYDITYNFNEKLSEYIKDNGMALINATDPSGAEDYRNHLIKEYVQKLYEDLQKYIPTISKMASYQYECGLETFNHHIQMRIKLIKPKCFSPKDDKGIKELINNGMLKGCHITPTCNTALDNNDWNYLLKADTKQDDHYYFASNKWTITNTNGESRLETLSENIYIPRQYRNLILLMWQQWIIDNLDKFDTRIINYVYDPLGCKGKSTLAGIADLMYNCVDMPPINDFEKLIATLCDICMGKDLRSPKAVFIDLPRAMEKNKLHGFIQTCEQIKKGKLYDVRHHYKEYWIDSPQIWIFSNTLIDFDLLSRDRWKLWIFDDQNNLINKEIIDCDTISFNSSN